MLSLLEYDFILNQFKLLENYLGKGIYTFL